MTERTGARGRAASGAWADWADTEAGAIRSAGRWRAPRDFDAAGPEGALAPDGRRVISFASNDYLGLANHPAVVAAAHAALDRWGAGSGAARLVVGSRPIHTALEAELAQWKHSERAVLFPTGFAANLGVITTFGGPDTLICCDELNHASLIDGARLARGEVAVYRHCDLEHLSSLLAERGDRRALVVTDTVFSMDGDAVALGDLVSLCEREGALLALDEAHSVLGPEPDLETPAGGTDGVDGTHDRRTAGSAQSHGTRGGDVLRLGTLSKTLGSLGGYVAAPARFAELVVNRARSYIFTTAPAPADSAAALAALQVLRSAEGDALVARLRSHVERLRPGHPSPILPVICGSEERALRASAALLERGMLVPAIRPPTVPPGTSRLRVTVSAAHTDAQIAALASALAEICPAAAPDPGPPARDGTEPRTPTVKTTHLDGP